MISCHLLGDGHCLTVLSWGPEPSAGLKKLNPPLYLKRFPPLLKMAQRPPKHPRAAWEETLGLRESSSLLEPYMVSPVQPLWIGE